MCFAKLVVLEILQNHACAFQCSLYVGFGLCYLFMHCGGIWELLVYRAFRAIILECGQSRLCFSCSDVCLIASVDRIEEIKPTRATISLNVLSYRVSLELQHRQVEILIEFVCELGNRWFQYFGLCMCLKCIFRIVPSSMCFISCCRRKGGSTSRQFHGNLLALCC